MFTIKNSISNRGQLFSFDLVIAVVLCIIMLFIILQNLNSFVTGATNAVENIEKQRVGVSLADIMIKNSDINSGFYGCAKTDYGLKRVLENDLDPSKITNIANDVNNLEKYKIGEIYFVDRFGGREEIYNSGFGNDCWNMERFVLYNNQKVKFVVGICNE